MKLIMLIIFVVFLSACQTSHGPSTSSSGMSAVSTLASTALPVAAGVKCPANPVIPPCSGSSDITANIDVDGTGAPVAVDYIQSCDARKVKWKYRVDVVDAPPFLVIFDPSIYPGNGNFKVLSSPKPNAANVTNQEFRLNTRPLKRVTGECLDYIIVIPGKGILDPVFIIER